MGRSQRHKLEVQGVTSYGETSAQPAGGPTDISISANTHAANLAANQAVGTLTITGGTAPYGYTLLINPYSTYKMVGAVVTTALNGPHVTGARVITVRVTDALARYFDKNLTITVS